MEILVAGAAGFIGSQYVRSLLSGDLADADGVQVTVLDSLTYSGDLANLDPVATSPGYRRVRGDICGARLVDEGYRANRRWWEPHKAQPVSR